MHLLLAILFALAPIAAMAAPALDARTMATYPFRWSEHDLTGPGADRLRAVVRSAQFVLVGEGHNDRDTPLFTRALYEVLNREDGFSHLVVEQDPLGVEMVLASAQRGSAAAIGERLRTSPSLLGFASDQDLALLADAGAIVSGPDAIWGLEQAQAPVPYLEALAALAPAGPIRSDVDRLLNRARNEERNRKDFGNFLAADRQTLPDLRRLAAQWSPPEQSRARTLLDGLLDSAQLYDYHVKAHAAHNPAFTYSSGTIREAWLKSQFIRDYRATGATPRVLFKLGANHIGRGVGTTGAWTLGTFAADLATYNGMDAYGILVIAIGGDNIHDWRDLPAEIVPLLPPDRPTEPILVDLTALRPSAQRYIDASPAEARGATAHLLYGYDAIVVLPQSAPATWTLTGFTQP